MHFSAIACCSCQAEDAPSENLMKKSDGNKTAVPVTVLLSHAVVPLAQLHKGWR